MALKIGDEAPEFNLKDQFCKNISLRDFKGKNLILLFFPFANSSSCTKEMSIIRDNLKEFSDLNASVVGISVDSPHSLRMWAEKNNFNFPLLSDFNKEVSPEYDSLYEVYEPGKYNFKGVCKRTAFVIDKTGKIIHIEFCETTEHQPHFETIEKILRE